MRQHRFLILLLACDFVVCEPVFAAEPDPRPAANRVPVFRLVTQVSSEDKTKVIGGVRVDPKNWPALTTAVVDTVLIDGEPVQVRCSGSLIGPGVMLTAAHCLDYGDTRPLRTSMLLEVSPQQQLTLQCDVPMQYKDESNQGKRPRVKEDYALCSYDVGKIAISALPLFEVLDIKEPVKAGSSVMLTGWGCQVPTFVDGRWQFRGATDDPDAQSLTVAQATVARTPNAQILKLSDGFLAIESNVYDAKPPATLCQGDSGGGMFTAVSLSDHNSPRRIRAVNSWVAWKGKSNSIVESLIAPLASQEFVEFAKGWLRDGRSICGFEIPGAPSASHCRQ